MNDKDLKKLHSFLLKEQRKLEKNIKKLGYVSFGKDVDSGDEEADETEEKATNIAISDILEKRLKGIVGALAKIDAGTYGFCEKCGGEISARLLQIDPESKLCQGCKIKHG